MKLVSYTEIRQFIPKKSGYYAHEKSQWANDYDRKVVWFHDGNFDFADPLNLDEANRCLGQPERDEYPFFILINGNARFSNIFNTETDGSTGLVVLGNLIADNIVVGGQGIFVTGDLTVKDLFWGDYNHGSLTANGKISARVFINTDYGTDYERFKNGKNIEIEHLLTDEQEDGYTEGDLLRALVDEKFINRPEEITDDVYSWKDWLKGWLIMEALGNNEPVLLKEWNTAFFSKEEDIPDFFEGEEITKKNLLRFTESNLLQPEEGKDGLRLEYWEGDVFRRAYVANDQPLSTTIYLQHDEEFGCMVYMGKRKSLLRKSNYVLAKAYRQLPDGEWLDLDHQAPEKYHRFLDEQWKLFVEQYTEMHYWWNRFKTEVTADKINAILGLPMIQDKHNNYYDDGNTIFFGLFQWSFRPPQNSEGRSPRISVIWGSPDDAYDFYHYDIEGDTVQLFDQKEDGYEATIYYVSPHQYEKVRKAVRYFEKLERHVYRLNEAYLQVKDIEVNRFELVKSALRSIIKLCLSEPHLSAATAFLEKMTEDDLKEGFDLLDALRLFCEDHDVPFLVHLDWKAETEDFLYFLDRMLKENFGLEIDLSGVSVPEDSLLDKVMQKYDRLLRGHGLQLGFANDYSDSYIFFVHRREVAAMMDSLFEMTGTGYEYQEAKNL